MFCDRSKGTGKHRFLRCDGQLLANAKAFTDQYAVDNKSLDILVLTQGIATIQGRTETSEGLDQKLATHYYGRMAFLAGLLPLLRASAATGDFKPRVLTVLSAGAHSAYPHYDTDPELKEHYSLGNAAAAGCMYNDIAVDALSRDPANAGITFVHAAPVSRWRERPLSSNSELSQCTTTERALLITPSFSARFLDCRAPLHPTGAARCHGT